MTRLRLACVLAIALPRVVFADEPAPPPTDPAPAPEATAPETPAPPTAEPVLIAPRRDLAIEVPGERTRNNKLLVGGLLAAGVISSALGVYYHLDSRDASDAVSADEFTGKAWTQASIDLVNRADRSKTRAIVGYSIGGAFLVGAIVTYIMTDPKSETAIIRTGGVTVVPTSNGGTVVGKAWSF